MSRAPDRKAPPTPESLTIPEVWEALKLFGEIRQPAECDEPILGPALRQALHQWLYELNHEAALRAVGVKPRARCLLSGPPGTGKTTLAHHIAARLGYPLLVVEASSLLSKWVNESGSKVALLFALARRVPVAIFLDELDATATSRTSGESGGSAENNKVVIALLQAMDRCDTLVFGATNRADNIDPAIWRRFQIHMTVDLPEAAERFLILKRYAAPLEVADETIGALVAVLAGASPALIKDVMEGVRRDFVIGPKLKHDMGLRAVFTRIAASTRPSDEMPTPPLWAEQVTALDYIAAEPWPPVIATRKKAA